jgi:hypothetical protein
LDQYILVIMILQALLTNGPQVIHVFKFVPDRYERLFYSVNLLFTIMEFGVAFSTGGFVDRKKDLCSGLKDAITATHLRRAKAASPFLSLCIVLVGFDVAVSVIDRWRNKGVKYENRRYIRPHRLTWKVTYWTALRIWVCLVGVVVWVMSVVTLEFFVVREFHLYVQRLPGGFYSLENTWSYGQWLPFAVAIVGILYMFRQWAIQPGQTIPDKKGKGGENGGKGEENQGKVEENEGEREHGNENQNTKKRERYGEGWPRMAARRWQNFQGLFPSIEA